MANDVEIKKDDKAVKIKTRFDGAHAFKNTLGLIKNISRCVLFENGKQWNMDEDIKEYPKITLNIIKQIGKVRKSNIMQNEYGYLVNSTNFKSVRKLQDFLKYQAAIVNMRSKDLKALSDDYTKGTAIGYFYWDKEKRGFMRKSGGEMRYEIIDIRRFAVANPYIQSIQDQEWVIFVSEEKINSLKYRFGTVANELVPDSKYYTNGTEVTPVADNFDEEIVNVYTQFYRDEQGEVHFTICTENTVLKEGISMNPWYIPAPGQSTEEQPNTTSLSDEKGEKKKVDKRANHIWNLYPFCRLCLNELDNCFYGTPIPLEYIETQKSINNHFSVYDKALQDNVLGGYMFRKGVIDPSEIGAENGNMLQLDILPTEPIQNAFSRIPAANVPADSHNYSTSLISIVRQVAGASNVQLGTSDYNGQSGKQTQMLLERARENSSDNAMLFNQFKKEQAEIMFLFAKFYYDNEDFSVIEHGYMEDSTKSYTGNDRFNGTEYLDDDVVIDIKVGSAPSFSEYNNIELMGLMAQSGQLPPEAYLTALPDDQYSNKQELLKIAKNNSQTQIKSLEEQLKQMNVVVQKMAEAYKQTEKDRANIDTIVRENATLQSMIGEIASRAIKKIGEATDQTVEQTKEMQTILGIINGQKTV